MRPSVRFISLLIALAAVGIGIWLFVTRSSSGLPNLFQEPVAPLVEPVIKDISADRGWQNTGILLESGETVQFQFMSGEIRDGEAVIRGPAGVGWACGAIDCCEPIPEVDRDALIGRVGDHLFPIGDRSEITVSAGGELQLRLNDCDAGLFDNSGSFRIKISP